MTDWPASTKGARAWCPVRRKLVPYDTPPLDPWDLREKRGGEIFEKECRCCGRILALSHFSPSRGGRGGVKCKCKECCAQYARVYGRTALGKAARARAAKKFKAQEKAQQAREAALEQLKQHPVGRALLVQIEAQREVHKWKPIG